MSQKHRKVIAVITAVANYFDQKQILKGIISEAQKCGCDVAVFSNIYNLYRTEKELIGEQRIYELVRSDEIDAIILVGEAFVEESLKQIIAGLLEKKTVPIITVGAALPEFANLHRLQVNTSDSADLDALTSHLIERHGFTEIDLLTGYQGNPISEERAEGYQAALLRHGIMPDIKRIHYGDFWYNSGDQLAARYVSGELPLPQAIVCANEFMAYGILRTFADNHISVPQQVTVVAYEYSDMRMLYTPLLTCYQRNREALGRQAVMMLRSIMAGETPQPMAAPSGTLICGESCSCPRNQEKYIEELKFAVIQKDHDFWNLYDKMDEKLTECQSMDEFVKAIGETQWMIRYVQNVYLCLYSEWYDANAPESDTVICRSVMPWLDTSPFESNRFCFSDIFRQESKPAAYYFSPLFFHTRLLGHVVLKYDNPDGYDDIFRNWMKTVSNGLEFLRMKNDISFLTKCQNISETRDTMTGLLNEHGIRQAFGCISGADTKFVVLRILVQAERIGVSDQTKKVNAILGAAKTAAIICGAHDAAARLNEKVFVCLVQSKAEPAQLADLLACLLIQNKDYMDYAGMDSFVCAAVSSAERCFSECYAICCASNEEMLKKYHAQKQRYNYDKMYAIRNLIYTVPEITLDAAAMQDIYFIKPDSLRIAYKKCFGISFHQDCISARLARAKYLLASTTLKTADIAERCGYLDNKYFMRQFLKNIGKTAIEYRSLFGIGESDE